MDLYEPSHLIFESDRTHFTSILNSIENINNNITKFILISTINTNRLDDDNKNILFMDETLQLSNRILNNKVNLQTNKNNSTSIKQEQDNKLRILQEGTKKINETDKEYENQRSQYSKNKTNSTKPLRRQD